MLRQTWMACAVAALLGVPALAACPPDCVGGGGPGATDCFVAFDGLTTTSEICVDGAACDLDGRADGVCTFGVQACVNVAGMASCTPGGLSAAPTVKPASSPAAQALGGALAALDPAGQGCTSAGVVRVPLTVGLGPLKPAVAKLTVTASSGGKRDRDRLRLTCQPPPAAPSFAGVIQPIFTQRCAIPACHLGSSPSGSQNLEEGQAYAESVGVRAVNNPKLSIVLPGNVKKSYLARKILGRGIGATSIMPQGCPGFPPTGGCLEPEETYAILLWIQNGAPDN